MSSLRLALKQSLEDTTKIDTDHRRRMKKLKKKKKLLAAQAAAAAAAGNNDDSGGTNVGGAIHYLKQTSTTSGLRDPLKEASGSASSSTLSSSDDDDDDSSSSSSSSSSDSSSSSSDDSSSSSSSEDSSSSSDSSDGEDSVDREAKQLFDADLSSSDDEQQQQQQPHAKTLNTTIMYNNIDEQDENSSMEKRRRKRLKKQSKTKLKARRKLKQQRREEQEERFEQQKDNDDAAGMIQGGWKKDKGEEDQQDGNNGGDVVIKERGYPTQIATEKSAEIMKPPPPPISTTTTSSTTAGEAKTSTKKTSKTVEPPTPQILQHLQKTLPPKRQRRSIHTNLRVKVRFVKKSKDPNTNKITRKLKWYGGVIVDIGNKGRKIKIEYDDGTSEVADFPDRDIVVDDVGNGVQGFGRLGGGSSSNLGGGEGEVVNRGSVFRPSGSLVDVVDEGKMISGDKEEEEEEVKEGEEKQQQVDIMMDMDATATAAVSESKVSEKEMSSSPPEETTQTKIGESSSLAPGVESNEAVVEGAAVEEKTASIVEELSNSNDQSGLTTVGTNSSTTQPWSALDNTAATAEKKEEEGKEASSEEEGEILETTSPPAAPAPVEETNSAPAAMFTAQGGLNPIVTKDVDVAMSSSSLPQKEADSVPTPSLGGDEKEKMDGLTTIGAEKAPAAPTAPSPSKKTTPEKEKDENASSSSGSTCSSVSFAGPSAAAAAGVVSAADATKMNEADVPVEMPSHVNLNGEDGNGEAALFDEEDSKEAKKDNANRDDDDDDDEEEEGEIDEGNEAASSKPPKEEPPSPKKRGPLRIRIGLSAAVKRKIEEEMDAMNDGATPRSKKKVKLASNDDGDGDANMVDVPANVALPSTETTEKLKEPQGGTTEELARKKRKSVDSEDASDGEIQEDGGSKKLSGVDEVAPPKRKKPGRKKKMTEIEKLKRDTIIEKSKKDSTIPDKDGSMNEMVDADSGKSPRSLTSDTADDDNAFSMARVGRRAAQRAAEKIAEKKTKKKSKESVKDAAKDTAEDKMPASPAIKAKKEEDPWVQCDRCHKWRHLPATVNLDDLPEHWFCELNTHDPKRNNCEAPEQTPKEVAKEKKRAKKLAWKKLQMEQAQALAKEAGSKKRARSTSPPPELDAVITSSVDKKTDDHDVSETAVAPSSPRSQSPKPLPPKPKRRGRPPRSDKEKEKTLSNVPNAALGGKGKDAPKQEWVQCEKCEKWRRLPPRISAEELPDVWYCSMNTWDINLATCTAIEDKHEENSKEYNVQSQIPTFAGSSSKTSYRNLIFGNGRQKRNISERMRAQESLFARDEDVDMSAPPTAMYAKSSAFFNKSLAKASAQETNKVLQPSIFDYMACSRVWGELNHMRRPNSKHHLFGYDKFCQPDGSLNKDAVDTLKAMAFFALGKHVLSGNEVLLQVQLQRWDYEVPTSWLELRSLSTIEIVNFILDELVKDGLVECIVPDKIQLDNALYRQRTISSDDTPKQQGIEAPVGCLKISKPWK